MASGAAHIDSERLEQSLRRLPARPADGRLQEALEQVLQSARVLFHASGTGLMAIDEARALCYVAATDEPGRLLEQTQEEVGEGPCVDALAYDVVVQTRDLAGDERWPKLKPKVPAAGVHAVLGVPVHVAGESVGALDAYVDHRYEWDDSDVEALQAYADLIGSLFASALELQERSRVVEQLQHALENRVVIERAVGLIMGRHGVDAVSAFNDLRRAARDRRQRVADLARRLLAGQTLD